MSKAGDHLTGLVTGLVIGGLFGLLYAPDKGTHTRARLSYELDKYKKKLEQLLAELRHQESKGGNKAKEEGQSIIQSAKKKAEKLLSDVDGLIQKINPGESKAS